MRLLLTLIIMLFFSTLKAQTISPGFMSDIYTNSIYHSKHIYDSTAPKKWFVSRSVGINAGYSSFNGGHASIISAPLSLQLNRRLNNNLYAFAGVSVAPSYISFSNTFLNTDPRKINTNNNFYKNRSTGVYSSAALGLMYINDARTFSISGSISIERDNYPVYYYNPVNTTKPKNNVPAYR
jgi:hypothetical protein